MVKYRVQGRDFVRNHVVGGMGAEKVNRLFGSEDPEWRTERQRSGGGA